MSDSEPKRVTIDQFSTVSQYLALRCSRCAFIASYNVGRIWVESLDEGELTPENVSFSNYFKCEKCGSSGPFAVEDRKRLRNILRSYNPEDPRWVCLGHTVLFDNTLIQSPAIGEDYLRHQLEKDPGNAFLCTRLGNLFRSCGMRLKAEEYYLRATGLGPGDTEALYHLLSFALDDCDAPGAWANAKALVRAYLEGRTMRDQELTDNAAYSIAHKLRSLAPPLREYFLAQLESSSDASEILLIRQLLTDQGSDSDIIWTGASELLGESTDDGPDFCPSLLTALQAGGLNENGQLLVVVNIEGRRLQINDRNKILFTDGEKQAEWNVPSLRELFRGSRLPPSDIEDPEYLMYLMFIETQLLAICDRTGDFTDREIGEVYSALRRRPDGRSLTPLHAAMWQKLAYLLGTFALSEAQFDAILLALEGSCRFRAMRPVSRNYIQHVRRFLNDPGLD